MCLRQISVVKDWIGTQSPAWTRLVPYDDEVEVPHELGGGLARTFGSFDEHRQLPDHANRGISLHIDLPKLQKQRALTNWSCRTRPSERPGIVRSPPLS